MKGLRTVLYGAVVAIAPSALTYLGGVDWTSLGISPTAGGIIGAGIIALRTVTSTPIGQK
jgi:hypothetical protein